MSYVIYEIPIYIQCSDIYQTNGFATHETVILTERQKEVLNQYEFRFETTLQPFTFEKFNCEDEIFVSSMVKLLQSLFFEGHDDLISAVKVATILKSNGIFYETLKKYWVQTITVPALYRFHIQGKDICNRAVGAYLVLRMEYVKHAPMRTIYNLPTSSEYMTRLYEQCREIHGIVSHNQSDMDQLDLLYSEHPTMSKTEFITSDISFNHMIRCSMLFGHIQSSSLDIKHFLYDMSRLFDKESDHLRTDRQCLTVEYTALERTYVILQKNIISYLEITTSASTQIQLLSLLIPSFRQEPCFKHIHGYLCSIDHMIAKVRLFEMFWYQICIIPNLGILLEDTIYFYNQLKNNTCWSVRFTSQWERLCVNMTRMNLELGLIFDTVENKNLSSVETTGITNISHEILVRMAYIATRLETIKSYPQLPFTIDNIYRSHIDRMVSKHDLHYSKLIHMLNINEHHMTILNNYIDQKPIDNIPSAFERFLETVNQTICLLIE